MFFARSPLSFPKSIETALLRGLLDGGAVKTAQVGAALAKLWPVLARERGRRGSDGSHYSFDPSFARAYAAYYLPANLMKVALVLEEMHLLGLSSNLGPLRWLDIGTGPGTALWGLAWWAKNRGIDFEFRGLEQSAHFISIAQKLGRELVKELYGNATPPRIGWDAFRHSGGAGDAGDRKRQGAKSLVQWVRSERPGMVSFVNSIDELVPDPAARAEMLAGVIGELRAFSSEIGRPAFLILVEPGTLQASRELIILRDRLMLEPDVRVWLPCLSHRPCGALARQGDWCHEAAEVGFPSWLGELGAAAGLRKEAVLFSYLVCSVGAIAEPAGWPEHAGRVVSQMMHEKGLDHCFLCTENGKKRARLLHSRKTPAAAEFENWARGSIIEKCALSEKGDVVDVGLIRADDGTIVYPKPQ